MGLRNAVREKLSDARHVVARAAEITRAVVTGAGPWTLRQIKKPIRKSISMADTGSRHAIIFTVNNLRKIRPGVIASMMATPPFNFCVRRMPLVRKMAGSRILAPVRAPFKAVGGWLGKKIEKLEADPRYNKHLVMPARGVLAVVKFTIKDFFRDIPKPEFFDRAFKAAFVVGILAVGLPMALGMGLSVAQMMAIAMLQIPLNVFQKSLENAAKQYIPTEDLNHKSVVRYRKQIAFLGLVGMTLGALLFMSPWMRVALGGVALAATRELLSDTSRELAKKHTKKAFEEQAVNGGMRIVANEDVVDVFTGLPSDQRREIFEQLRRTFGEDFNAVATRPATAPPAEQELQPLPAAAPGQTPPSSPTGRV